MDGMRWMGWMYGMGWDVCMGSMVWDGWDRMGWDGVYGVWVKLSFSFSRTAKSAPDTSDDKVICPPLHPISKQSFKQSFTQNTNKRRNTERTSKQASKQA